MSLSSLRHATIVHRVIGVIGDPCKKRLFRDTDSAAYTQYREILAMGEVVRCPLADAEPVLDFRNRKLFLLFEEEDYLFTQC